MTVTLHVCITCRAGQTLNEGETTPGARLHAAILDFGVPEGVSVVLPEPRKPVMTVTGILASELIRRPLQAR